MESRQLVSDFLDYSLKVLNFSPTTVRSHRYVLGRFMKWLEKPLINLEITDLDDYFKLRIREITPASLNTDKAIIRAFLNYCLHHRKIQLSFDPRMIRNNRVEEKEICFYTLEEIKTIIKNLNAFQDKLIIAFMFETGMRIGEIVRLQLQDIHETEITVRGKGGKKRLVFISEDLYDLLLSHIRGRRITQGTIFRQECPKASRVSDAYSVQGLRLRLQRQLTPKGIEFRPHSVRHSHATSLLQNGADIRSIQKLLGHMRIDTTMRYTHVTDHHLKKVHATYFPQINYNIDKEALVC